MEVALRPASEPKLDLALSTLVSVQSALPVAKSSRHQSSPVLKKQHQDHRETTPLLALKGDKQADRDGVRPVLDRSPSLALWQALADALAPVSQPPVALD